MKNGEQQPDMDALRANAQQEIRNLRQKITHLDESAIDLILTGARSHYAWKDVPVTEQQIRDIYDIVKMGSTGMNGCPARFVRRGYPVQRTGSISCAGRA